jgi:hypothetical protein
MLGATSVALRKRNQHAYENSKYNVTSERETNMHMILLHCDGALTIMKKN